MLSNGERKDKSNDDVDRRMLVEEMPLTDDLDDETLGPGESMLEEEKESWTWRITLRSSEVHSAERGRTNVEPSMNETVKS